MQCFRECELHWITQVWMAQADSFKEIEKVTERLISKIAIFSDKALYAAGG